MDLLIRRSSVCPFESVAMPMLYIIIIRSMIFLQIWSVGKLIERINILVLVNSVDWTRMIIIKP